MRTEQQMKQEIEDVGRRMNLPADQIGEYCHSGKDGDCIWKHCPQNRDNEPCNTNRHCPLDIHEEERGYQ